MHDRRPPGAERINRVSGRRIYSLELDELNKASLRWMVNNGGIFKKKNWQKKKDILWPLAHDGGTLPRSQGSVYKDELDKALEASYGAHRFSDIPIDIFAHDEEKVKSIFDLLKEAQTGSIFDLVCNPLVRDSLTWSWIS